MKLKFFTLITFVLLSYLSTVNCSVALAYDIQQPIKVRTIAIAPYGIIDDKPPRGIYFDLANSLLRRAGLTPVNHIAPYARIMHDLKTGSIDLTIMFRYKELEDYVTYIAPLPPLNNVVLAKQGTHFSSIESLKGKTIAYLRGAKFSDDIDNDPDILKHQVTNFNQGIRMLSLSRVDAIIGPMDPLLAAAAALNKKPNFFGKPLIVSQRTPWIQYSNSSQAVLPAARIKMLFEQMMVQGELEQLRNKYISRGPSLTSKKRP
ncbi:ABC transporter substrate-binding protein [Psychrobium sp. 1_MG-2023]|uniref:substrate-binding periplasmic protein n=1 Tax=Psychrobium sp. 1_MG-2023 TaxID=3062624 RepID=UPI000C340856|nr:transporter substrate-binding domain-containing protein [Psychrobium sp. 1_MG-2023]MDP2562325.1 transporter substrate-binding domain-containing protein [Psychrobium sp. 1_MG-2023]PKF58065.1 hypothetical protein CW748_04495 [Alteromonadales bacterium alter-6D02]